MDGCSFVIKETPDQKLLVSDAFVIEEATGESRKLDVASGTALDTPMHFHDIEWAAEYPGNELEDKAAVRWVLKTYLIAVDPHTESLDLDRVALLDAATRSMSFPSVTRLAPADTPEEYLELRIRDSGLVIDTLQSLPDAEAVARSKLAGVPARSQLEVQLQVQLDGASGAEQEQDNYDDDAFDIIEDDSEDMSDFLIEVGDEDSDSEDGDFGEEGDDMAGDDDDDFD